MTASKVPTALETNAALIEGAAGAAAPLLGPNAILAVVALSNIANALIASFQTGKDVTDETIAELFDLDAAADRADAISQTRGLAREAAAKMTQPGIGGVATVAP